MEDLNLTVRREQLLNKRRSFRGQVTRRCTQIDHLINLEVWNEDVFDEIDVHFQFLKENKIVLRQIHETLEESFGAQELEQEIINMEEYEARIEFLRLKCERHKTRYLNKQTPVQTQDLLDRSTVSDNHNLVKLPQLDIEPFKGDFASWVAFWEDFQGTIHDNSKLNKVTKFKYLRSFLRDAPLRTVKNYELSDVGYDLAIQQLKEDYAKPDKLQAQHIRALHELPVFRNAGDFSSLKAFEADLRKHVVALKRLGVDPNLFMQFVVPKLPKTFFQAFTAKHDDWASADVLLNYLKASLNSLPTWEEGQENFPHEKENLTRRLPTAATLTVSTNSNSSNKRPFTKFYCVICGSIEHGSRVCNAQLSLQEKKDILISKGRCIKCLRVGHMSDSCQFPFDKCRRCDAEHFQSLCPMVHLQSAEVGYSGVHNKNVLPAGKANVNHSSAKNTTTKEYLLRTAKAFLSNGSERTLVTCLIDGGSQRSFVRKSCAELLNLPIVGQESLTTGAFGGVEQTSVYDRVSAKLMGLNVENSLDFQLLIEETPSGHEVPVLFPQLKTILDEMLGRGLILANTYDHNSPDSIDVILGMDYYNRIMTGKTIRLTDDIMAQESVFGWTVLGVLECWDDKLIRQRKTACNVVSAAISLSKLDEQLQFFWALDAIGIESLDKADQSIAMFEEEFSKTTSYFDDRYSVALPWREGLRDKLASNFNIARKRLNWLVLRLRQQKDRFEDYAFNIESYIRNNHAEKVTYFDLRNELRIGFYLPHHAVYNAEKSTKTRVVFDASSHEEGELSLNECLDPGPDRGLDIVKVLYAFRTHKWALTGDLKKAFLQIELNPEDRDFVRFLWIDRNLPEEEQLLKPDIFRMKRVLFGVSSSPSLLKYTIKLHMNKFIEDKPQVVQRFLHGSYVDDLATSVDGEEELVEMKQDTVDILRSGGFEMHRVRTNHPIDDVWQKAEGDTTPCDDISVLGLKWNRNSDNLIVRIPEEVLQVDKKITKRNIISKASSIFDPLGWLFPITIIVKMLFQLMWLIHLPWDSLVTPEIEDKWRCWLKLVSKQRQWQLPRFLFFDHCLECGTIRELHIFCDASPKAYGAVAYLLSRSVSGVCKSSFLQARFRVAPIKPVSIPCLELLAALLASRIAEYIKINSGLTFNERFFWCDSQDGRVLNRPVKLLVQLPGQSAAPGSVKE